MICSENATKDPIVLVSLDKAPCFISYHEPPLSELVIVLFMYLFEPYLS